MPGDMKGKTMLKFERKLPDEAARSRAQQKWDNVAKPLNALGRMEKLICRIAAVQGSENVQLSPRCALVFCADHGVVAEGVSQSGQEVTALVAGSIAEGSANVNLMASAAQTDVFAVDMGMAGEVHHPALIRRSIARGTKNMAIEPAMTREQALCALQAGIDLAGEMKARGYRMIATGEMGIGNTTAAAAVAGVLLDAPAETMTGRGAGLSDAGLARKISAVKRAVEVNQPDKNDPVDVLAKLGGFELAAMAGAFLGGMTHGIPVVIDGVISAVSALIALRICPEAGQYMLPSHMSREPAGRLVMDALGLEPVIDAGMALGEGTGAVMLFPLLDMAHRVYCGNHTFDDLGMDAYTPQEGKA